MNRIYRVRQEVDETLDDMEKLDDKELYLQDQVDELKLRVGDETIMTARRVISALEYESDRLDREISDMKMSILMFKGKNRQLQKDLQEVRKAKSFYWMAKAMWEHAKMIDEECPVKSSGVKSPAARSA